MKRIIAFALCLIIMLVLYSIASADFIPTSPVYMVVGFEADSSTDKASRLLADYAEKYIDQIVVVENITGKSGGNGWTHLAKADTDGLTIGVLNLPVFNMSIVNKMGAYKTRSFAPICNYITDTAVVIVRTDDDRFPDLTALVEYGIANQNDEKILRAATNGPYATNHIWTQAFANSACFFYNAVPQMGTKEELQSLQNKKADFCIVKISDIIGQEDHYRILGIFAENRLSKLPEVPTLKELGYFDKWMGSAYCIVAPVGVDDDVIKLYEATFRSTMEDSDFLEIAEQDGLAVDFKNASETAALIAKQQEFIESLEDDFWYE